MVGIAFVAQTCAVGLAYGVYGTVLGNVQSRFETSRTLASAGMSALLLSQALVAPLVGELLLRISIRSIMTAGALLFVLGYILLNFADSIYTFLAVYALILGPAYCMLGHIPGSTLVGNWFEGGRGRALGLSNMPVALFVFPPIAAAFVLRFGIHGVYIAASLLALAIVPLLWRIRTKPSVASSKRSAPGRAPGSPSNALDRGAILRTWTFWMIILGNGAFIAAGLSMAIMIVPLAQSRGIGLQTAAVIASAYGIGTMIGAPLWGWVVDRLGSSRTFVVLAGVEAVFWAGMYFAGSSVPLIMIAAMLIGMCSGGASVPLLTATLADWLGQASFSRAIGLCYFFKIPFSFGAPILGGYLFDITGDYQASVLTYVIALPVVAIIFCFFRMEPINRIVGRSPHEDPGHEGTCTETT